MTAPVHSVISIFTSAVILRQAASSPLSQVCASSSEAFGLTLTNCLANCSCSAGAFAASPIALNSVAYTSFGVLAGASMLCQCKVPTPG